MSTYITLTNTSSYKYRRKVPTKLKDYIPQREIIKSLGKNHTEALKQSEEYNRLIIESIEIASMSAIPISVKLDLISNKLSPILNITPIAKTIRDTYRELAEDYLQSLSVSSNEIRDRSYILLEIFPSAFQVLLNITNPKVSVIGYTHLVKVRALLQQLPKRNIEKYRQTPLKDLMKGLHQGTLKVTENETISITTLNKYLKWINALMTFAVRQKIISHNPISKGLSIKRASISREERKEFTKTDLKTIEHNLQDSPIYPIIQISRYTGMRLSELYKCTITEIDGILCFDLRNPKGTSLKTLSSYRIIPIHDCLLTYLKDLQKLLNKFTRDYVSKRFKKDINRILDGTEGKSLYSLRHSFATDLISNGVQPEIVSELMGHAHSTMTMNRYVKGYPIRTLKESIDTL